MTLDSSKWVCYVCATGRRADCELSTGETQSSAPASFIFTVFVRQLRRHATSDAANVLVGVRIPTEMTWHYPSPVMRLCMIMLLLRRV